ncbi:hypothetical protein KAR91_04850 [Candidatus Pacearchaeota archaeon]|nr:hypothetical protein [Candidatus Pacearchaeota archaeon]
MEHYTCDRCEKDMGSWPDEEITIPPIPPYYSGCIRISPSPKKLHLCTDCLDGLRKYLEIEEAKK